MIKFMNVCAQVEETVSLIYQEFAANQKSDPELKGIWEKMARDEQQHAQQLQLAMRIPVEESFHAELTPETPDPTTLLLRGSEILEESKRKQLTVLQMLQAAVELEKEFLKIHATYALRFKTPSLRKTFEALARADKDHTSELNDYIVKFKAQYTKT